MAGFLVILLVVISNCHESVLGLDPTYVSGIEFGDNAAQKYLVQENGVALVSSQMFKQLTFCTWIYPRWSRWRKYRFVYPIIITLFHYREDFYGRA